MSTEEIVTTNNRPVCQPVTLFIKKLLDRGFIMLENGDYKSDYQRPNNDSLYFRLQSPTQLDSLDLSEDAYYLVSFSDNNYMCECHYHMVKLVFVE